MTKRVSSLTEKTNVLAGAITAMGGVLAAVSQPMGAVPEALEQLQGLSLGMWWLLVAVTVGTGLLWLREGLARRSRLLRPEDST